MSKKITFLISLLLLASCNTFPNENTVYGTIPEGSTPLRGFSKVSVHPDKLLKMSVNCDLVMKIEIIQKKNYAQTIMELKNRALIIGGNAVSLSTMKESNSSTYMIGKIYLCSKKPYHLHPHPLGI